MALRLAFMGTPDFAVPALAELIAQGHDIACVYSQPPRPRAGAWRWRKVPVHKFAESAGLPRAYAAVLERADEQAAFAALDLDAAIVVAYGLLLPKPILEAPRLGCFNLHGSLLPRWRGAAPIQRAVMAGDEETGVMVMRMEEGLDTGPVLMAKMSISAARPMASWQDELTRLGAELMAARLSALERGTVTAATAGRRRRDLCEEDRRIRKPVSIGRLRSAEMDCLIRGLSPTTRRLFTNEG